MKKDKWTSRLEEVKRQERSEAVLMIAGSAELTRIAVAWSGSRIARKKTLSACATDDAEQVWRWLWDNTDHSREDFLRRLPIPAEKADRLFESLVANRVLYPDGTVNSFVQRYLHERVLSLFRVRRPLQNRAVASKTLADRD